MQFLTKKKITFSLIILTFLIFCFFIFNKALHKDKMYFPKLKNEEVNYLPNFNLPELFSSNKIFLDDIVGDKDFSLVKQSRLSVMKVELKYWKVISKMGKV